MQDHKIDQTIENIRSAMDFFSIKPGAETITTKGSDVCKYQVSFKLADVINSFICVTTLTVYIRSRAYKLRLETILTHPDYTPVLVKDSSTIFLLARHILKLNSLFRFGSMSVDKAGAIRFHIMWNYQTNSHLAMRSVEDVVRVLKVSLATTTSTLKVNLVKLLTMIEIIPMSDYDDYVNKYGKDVRRLPKFFNTNQEQIADVIVKGVQRQLGSRNHEKIDPPTVDKLPEYLNPFYQKVKVKYVDYYGKLTEGQHSSIYVVKAGMTGIIQNGKVVDKDKYFLVKGSKKGNGLTDREYVIRLTKSKDVWNDERINNERCVLESIADKNFPHIARYYDDTSEDGGTWRPSLYTENYMPQNLGEFVRIKDVSLSTKLSWLYHLARALLHLRDNRVVHGHLKLSNIVIAKNFFVKVIDFTEAIIKTNELSGVFNGTTTMPYSSPEMVRGDLKEIDYSSDLFSYSHITYELITGRRMVTSNSSSENGVLKEYEASTFKTLDIKKCLNHNGPSYLVQYLFTIVMLCSLPDQTCRLPHENLVVAIKDYAYFIEKLF